MNEGKYITVWFGAECHFCGDKWEHDDTGHEFKREREIAESQLACAGWREVISKKFQTIALACKACSELKDKDR